MFAGMPRQILQQGESAFDTGLGCHTAGSLAPQMPAAR
jgi:hypothetical protein